MTLHALTLFPEYAALAALGYKTAETRPGPPAGNMRPPGVRAGIGGFGIDLHEDIVLVAASTPSRKVGVHKVGAFELERSRGNRDMLLRGDSLAWPYRIPSGCAMCVVKFFGAWPAEEVVFDTELKRWDIIDGTLILPQMDQALGDYSPGRWVLPMGEVRRFDPIRAPGAQGAYDLGEKLSDRIEGMVSKVSALTLWEYLRSGTDVAGALQRAPEWSLPWCDEVLHDLAGSFDREMDEVNRIALGCSAEAIPAPLGPYCEPVKALLAGDQMRAEQHIWARLRPHRELPQRRPVATPA